MMGWSPRCYIPSFVEIGPQVIKGEEDFRPVFTIWGRGGHLGHLNSFMSSDYYFLVPVSFHVKVGSDLQKRF